MESNDIREGICPKCGSDKVYSGANITNKSGAYYQNAIPTGGLLFPSLIALDNYVCTSCGYIESDISNPKDLGKIAEKWPRADGRPKRKKKTDSYEDD